METEKIQTIFSIVFTIVSFIIVAILLCTGNVKVNFNDKSFKIIATYWSDLEIEYSEIKDISYKTEFSPGVRKVGFGSAKLSLGKFQNNELGSYTLYAYKKAKEYILLKTDNKMIVIGMEDSKITKTIYEELIKRIDK